MQKKVYILLCALLIIALVVGMTNKISGKSSQEEVLQSGFTQPQEKQLAQTASTVETPNNGESTVVVRSYPELRLSINAQCPSATEARQLPVITARVSEQHFEELLKDIFVSRFPDAVLEKEEYEYAANEENPIMVTHKGWLAKDESSNILSYINIEEDGTMYFEDLYMATNGKSSDDSSQYKLVTDETEVYTGSFTQQESVDQAILTMKPYTDFDLCLSDVRKMRHGSGYNVVLQLMYQETPISLQLNLVSEESGISYASGISLFDQIQEEKSSSVMSLEDALSVLKQMSPELIPESYTWNVYHIQLEYYGEYDGRNNPGLYTFRPAWTFYYTEDGFDKIVRFYADTGGVCNG